MSLPGGLPKRLSDAVESYVGWRGGQRPVSLKRLVKATGFMMPELGLTEKELADLIAVKLVALGCNIHFDMGEESSPLPDHAPRSPRVQRTVPAEHGKRRPTD